MKFKIVLFYYVLLGIFKAFSFNNFFYENFYVNLTNNDLMLIKHYSNNKLAQLYKCEENNNEIIFRLNYKKIGINIYLYSIEIKNDYIRIIEYDKEKRALYSIEFFKRNGLIEKISSKERLQDSTEWIKRDVEYQYDNNNRLVKIIFNGKVSEEIIYNGNKIEKKIYYLEDGRKNEEIYRYKNDTDYECESSYKKLEGYTEHFTKKRVHYEKEEGNKKVITDEYYGDYFDKKGMMLFKTKCTILNDKVITYETYDGINNQIHKDEYIYSNDNEKELLIYFAPIVNNLRLREADDQNSKVIRLLTKGEKLRFIEQGKEETINGVKGNWVKVKTEKGEIGWCFDAYLEEVR